jgi:hypothetical protein
MSTSHSNMNYTKSLSKNIALSPYGYWPRPQWRRLCDSVKGSLLFSLAGAAIIFFTALRW